MVWEGITYVHASMENVKVCFLQVVLCLEANE